VYQLKDTGASIFLVHPDLADDGIAAAEEVGLARDKIFLFSNMETQSVQGVKDWRTMLAGEHKTTSKDWLSLNSSQARRAVATLNYSSG
jgi:4-coumarate--CoA ligase